MAETTQTTSPRTIAVASLGALLVAGLLLVAAVLPAEYGYDPLGTGQALGLLGLAQVPAVALEDDEYRVDSAEISIGPYEWVEYTYRLEEGTSMLFSWQATGDLDYNLHSAPDGAPPGYAESFDAQVNDQAHGSYTAAFTGVHGWYWENPSDKEVMLSLHTAGFYLEAHEARDRVDGYHPLTDLRGNEVPKR